MDSDLEKQLSKSVDKWKRLNMDALSAGYNQGYFLKSARGRDELGQCPDFQEMCTEVLRGPGIVVSATYS